MTESKPAQRALHPRSVAREADSLDSLPFQDSFFERLKKSTQSDQESRPLIHCWKHGRAENEVVLLRFSAYWPHQAQPRERDDIILKGTRPFILKVLGGYVLRLIRDAHLGTSKCRARANESSQWPRISTVMGKMPECCQQRSQVGVSHREPLIPLKMLQFPWQLVVADLFQHSNTTFLLLRIIGQDILGFSISAVHLRV